MNTLLKVATIAITHLAMDLGLKKQHRQRAGGRQLRGI